MMLFKNLSSNPYARPPSSEIDEAWSTLLEPMNIRVSDAELASTGQSSVALPEGGGKLLGWESSTSYIALWEFFVSI